MSKTPQFLDRKEQARRTKLLFLRIYVVSLVVLIACLHMLSQSFYDLSLLLTIICIPLVIHGGFMVILLSTPIKKQKNQRNG